MAGDALMPALVEDAASPSRLLALPQELLAAIVQMSRAQDKAFKERMAISRDRIKISTDAVTSENVWYGQSLRALYSTSKKLNDLCRPYVWESVKLSQTADNYFSDSLLERHGVFIRHLVFDFVPGGPTSSAFQGLLIGTLLMPNIEPLLLHQPALAALKTRFKKLSFEADSGSTDLVAALELWPNVTHLARNLRFATDLDLEGDAITKLASLTHLEIGSHSSYGKYNVEDLLVSDEDPVDWPEGWTELEWPAGLRSLSFASPNLRLEEWEFIAFLGDNLEELRIEMLDTHQSLQGDVQAEPVAFPRLRSFSITSALRGGQEILRLLQQSPISSVTIEIIDLESENLSRLLPRRKRAEGSLAMFSATLNTVDISQYGLQTDALRHAIRVQAQAIGMNTTLGGKRMLYSPIFCYTGEDLLRDASDSPIDATTGLRSALDLLHRTTASLSKIDIEKDTARLDIVKQALRSLAALDLLDRD